MSRYHTFAIAIVLVAIALAPAQAQIYRWDTETLIPSTAGITPGPGVLSLSSATFDSNTIYNQWTVFPEGFDPATRRLTLEPSPLGDLDGNDSLDAVDIDWLARRIAGHEIPNRWLPNEAFDLNGDGQVTMDDHRYWVHEVKQTWLGDANLDGLFASDDLVMVLAAGQYEDDIVGNSTWATGDWNGDFEFTSADLVAALADGGYEAGPRASVASVPEPASSLLVLFALMGLRGWRRRGI